MVQTTFSNEIVGTSGNDVIASTVDAVVFGLQGDDQITSGVTSNVALIDDNLLVGGSGNDTYIILSPPPSDGGVNGDNDIESEAAVMDLGGSSSDTVIISGLSLSCAAVGTIDNTHLYIEDPDVGIAVVIIDWLSPESRIETFIIGGQTFNVTGDGTAFLNLFSDFEGNITLLQYFDNDQAEANDFNTMISNHTVRQAELENTGTVDPDDGTPGDDNLVGSDGDDDFLGGDGNDTINAGNGNDTVNAGSGNDTLNGNAGMDFLEGGLGDDTMRGGQDDDFVQGNAGSDFVRGDKGNDTVRGGQGDDSVRGGQDDDLVKGDKGNDIVKGDKGNDTVRGGQDDDQVFGLDGDDIIFGDKGNDTLEGGDGLDVFAFSTDSGIDIVNDFVFDEDRVQFASAVFATAQDAVDAQTLGSNVVIDLGSGNTITLTLSSLLDLDDFIIV